MNRNSAGTVLVIEDDPGAAALQRKCLERRGYQVVTAASRQEALAALDAQPIELILLDYKLQDQETGLDLLGDLQATGRDIPCIIVTGYANEQLAIDAFRAGVRDFVPKSVTYLDSLPQAVDRVFREIHHERELRRGDEERRRLVEDLGERVKELTLLREVSRLLQNSQRISERTFVELVELLPSGFQRPELTTARIRIGEKKWIGKGFRPSPYMLSSPFRLHDGGDGLIEVACSTVEQPKGRPPFLEEEKTLLDSIAELLAVHWDRLQMTERLRRSEQRYRSLVEASTVVVWTADAEGQINSISPTLLDIDPGQARQALGDGWVELIHPDDVERVAATWSESVRTKRVHHVVARVQRPVGNEYMHCEIRGVPVLSESGEVLEWFGTMHDITPQRELEATLSQLAAIVESSDDAIISKTLDGIVLSWNPGAERIFGYTADEMIGNSIQTIMSPAQLEEITRVQQRVAAGEVVEPIETVRRRRDGMLIDVLVRLSPLRDGEGRVIGTSSIKHEITERKAAERRRQLQSSARAALADTASIEDAASRLIEAISVTNHWDGGCLWLIDEREKVMRFATSHFEKSDRFAAFGEFSSQLTFEFNKGLPGEAWCSRDAVWVADFDRQWRYPRAALARDLGLHTAIAFPLQIGERIVGSLEFFSADIRQPSDDDLAVMRSLSSQFALFVDRKQADAKRAELAAILEASTDFVGLTDPQGRFLYVNRAGRQMLGISESADLTNLTTMHCSPAWASELLQLQALPTAAREGSWNGEAAIWNRAGFEVPVSMLLLAHRDEQGKVQYFSAIGRDISEQKRDRESLVLHNRAMTATSEGIVITGPSEDDAPILYANEAFVRLSGYERSQIIGRNCRFLQGPESDPDAVATMRRAIQQNEPCTVEVLNYRADGSSFWSLVSITPVRDPDGRVTHYVGTQRDITERKQLEDQLRQTQKMEAIGSLAGGIAHDFNNMLTVILGYSEMARDTLPTESAAQDLIDEIVSAAERAATLTSQLLAFSRRQVLAPREIEVNSIISELQRLLRPLISENIAISLDLAPDLRRVKTDPSQFEQIVMNLVINARDAMPEGGKLTITTANTTLDSSVARFDPELRPGEYVMLKVSDTGCGMSREVLNRIFEPFFTTKPKGKGTGMGLATVYGIVKQSGGHITVSSEPGVGTTFRVYLPIAAGDGEIIERPALPPPENHTGAETILLVEDESAVRQFARQVLSEQGYRVLEASRGDDALAMIDKIAEKVDALVTDVVMPGMGGRQLADRLLEKRAGVKVLYISGYTDDVVSHHGVLEEGASFLQKPFSREALSRKLREVLDS